MIEMVVLSDRLCHAPIPEKLTSCVETYSWDTLPSRPLFEFEIIVLDMNIVPRNRKFGKGKDFVIPARVMDEVRRVSFESSTLICLNYYNRKASELNLIDGEIPYWRPQKGLQFSYQWLAEIEKKISDRWLQQIEFSLVEVQNAIKLQNISPKKIFRRYYADVRSYTTIIEDIKSESRVGDTTRGAEVEGGVQYVEGENYIVENIFLTKNTNDPIGYVIHYNGGTMVFLPQSEAPETTLIEILYEIGKYYYENPEKPPEHIPTPPWLDKYKLAEERKYETMLNSFRAKKYGYETIDALLYGRGSLLINAVRKVLEAFGLAFVPIDIDVPITLRGSYENKKFGIAVITTESAIQLNTEPMNSLWRYMCGKPAEEKVILVANAQCTTEPMHRAVEKSYTEGVLAVTTSNGICVISTYELYKYWCATAIDRKLSGSEVIDRLYTTNGLLTYS
jgi:hypothetical protein